MTLGDLAAVMPGRPDGIVLPKCAGAADVQPAAALSRCVRSRVRHRSSGSTRIVTVATETAQRGPQAARSFESVLARGCEGMMWGAEDLAASLGASRGTAAAASLPQAVPAGARSLPDQRRRRPASWPIDTVCHRHRRSRRRSKRRAIAARRDGFSAQGRDSSQACRCRQRRLHADRRGNRLVGEGRWKRVQRQSQFRRGEDRRQDDRQAASARR